MKKDGFLLFGVLFGLTTWIGGGHYVQASFMQYAPPQIVDTLTLTEDTHEEVFKKLEEHIDEVYEKNLTKSIKTQQTLPQIKSDPKKVERYNTLVATREMAIAMLAEVGGDISEYEHLALIGAEGQQLQTKKQVQNLQPVKAKKEKKVVKKVKKVKKDKKTKKVAKNTKKSRKSKAS